jgi:hypothetical protein
MAQFRFKGVSINNIKVGGQPLGNVPMRKQRLCACDGHVHELLPANGDTFQIDEVVSVGDDRCVRHMQALPHWEEVT